MFKAIKIFVRLIKNYLAKYEIIKIKKITCFLYTISSLSSLLILSVCLSKAFANHKDTK